MATTSTDLIEYLALSREAVGRQKDHAQHELEIARKTHRYEDAQAWKGYIHALNWVEVMLLSQVYSGDPRRPG